ncbi:hypothetical protein FNF27_06254 [Cafeteria roenbergensis]|jgi:large subunit ribosomal protein L18e|uniref:Large ribosomal subunit protein uL15/eL18 domain-containing protein n=2 Tax=Cafeteria roenbergensis TaxID=33653 RepID=A0A5A8CY57_CAFRO|nr:hypothetical protein FNF28_07553 [Cafeteria roenbergensis]KAA0149949.1 hypothetical protein FNF29_05569 [Cafeteria roenbergensis]KAA0157976.1 hypothetical protein FNF31_05616 [Cafeteria roenbergensis]KAA0171747.1 hypothetical protein FNF27_06254 [Cafeteria roenbergensis]|eukprot:KAA0149949.1 hypothetical protein FNF29_05569 [Cafeteria roenbergensis]
MGIDLVAGGRVVGHKHRTAPKSENAYLGLLVKLYEFLARRTGSDFCTAVHKRLMMSRANIPPMGLARIARYMKGKEDKTCVFVGTITDDVRLNGFKLAAMTICALRFTEGARARIEAAGGKCLTFDQLAQEAPRGSNTVLLRGRRSARSANKYFGVPGRPGSSTRPHTRSRGRKFEMARGRRNSRGFKV